MLTAILYFVSIIEPERAWIKIDYTHFTFAIIIDTLDILIASILL